MQKKQMLNEQQQKKGREQEQEQEQEYAGREARWGRSGAVDKGGGTRTRVCRKRSTLG
jgi:hypothetical protein